MSESYDQWIRKISLIVESDQQGIDLSEFRIKFEVNSADYESPNDANIRIYNLSVGTIERIRGKGEFNTVKLTAGYEGGNNFGVIFSGSIIQFRIGRESNIDTYLDILASDGDISYNQKVISEARAKGTTPDQLINAARSAMQLEEGYMPVWSDKTNVAMPRGAVLFGMARSHMRYLATTLDASWSIQNGELVMRPFKGYLPGEAVVLNRATGVIGVPEQTTDGIRVTCLLNPRIRLGGLVQLNNAAFNQLAARDQSKVMLAYDQWAGITYAAPLAKDGFYGAYAISHEGDTRDNQWFSRLTCIAVDVSAAEIIQGNK